MDIRDLLTQQRTLLSTSPDLDTKKEVLDALSHLLAKEVGDELNQEILNSLIARERLGSTSVGHGVVFPHARSNLVTKPVGALLHTIILIDFDTEDKKPADLFFGLLIPEDAEEEHLQILAGLAKSFSKKSYRDCLREAKDTQSLFEVAIDHLHTKKS